MTNESARPLDEGALDDLTARLRDYKVGARDGPPLHPKICDEAARAIESLIAALPASAERVPDGWRPIETAKLDGTKADLWCTSPGLSAGGGRVPDCWHSEGKWWRYDDSKYATDINNCRSEVWNVTHWRPLPAAPAPDGGGE